MSKPEFEIAVIGAGPYGLSIAAHMADANISTRVFGDTMSFWRNMPKGMKLRSSLSSTNLADPKGDLSFEAFAARQPVVPTLPIPLETFINYGEWFKENAVPDVDNRRIKRIESIGRGFDLRLSDGDRMSVQRVIVAVGLAKQEFRPAAFSDLPPEYVSHAGEYVDMSVLRGKHVAVIGRGQAACEHAALLSSSGADVELVSRGDVHWLGSEMPSEEPEDLIWRLHRLLATKSGVGPFPLNWLAEFPETIRWMPRGVREAFNARCLRPGATSWLKPGLANVKMRMAGNITAARVHQSKIYLQFEDGSAAYDHVLLATGYQSDISKLDLLAPELLQKVRCVDGSPELSAGFQSSVPGLHFVGSSSVMSYGPLMRFVAGSGYTARELTRYAILHRTAGRKHHKPKEDLRYTHIERPGNAAKSQASRRRIVDDARA